MKAAANRSRRCSPLRALALPGAPALRDDFANAIAAAKTNDEPRERANDHHDACVHHAPPFLTIPRPESLHPPWSFSRARCPPGDITGSGFISISVKTATATRAGGLAAREHAEQTDVDAEHHED